MERVFLLDAMALIYRGYFALMRSPRINDEGVNTSAILGFCNSLVDVIKKEKPTYILVAFDSSQPTFRHEVYSEYKANRQAQPEDISVAIPYIKELLKAFRIPFLAKDGYEADDIIGTLAYSAQLKGKGVYMVTLDKDFAQLVGPNIYLYRPGIGAKTSVVWGEKEVLEEWGVERASQVVDVLGLWGDASDNIPGVPYVGKKTAQKLVRKYGCIEGVLEQVDGLEGRVKTSLRNYAQQALLSKKLAKICLDVPLELDLEASRYIGPEAKELMKLCNKLGFRELPKRILGIREDKDSLQVSLFPASKSSYDNVSLLGHIDNTSHDYYCVDTLEKIQELVALLQKAPRFAFDTETTSLDTNKAELLGISFSITPYKAYYVSIFGTSCAKQLLEALQPIFRDPDKLKIGQNLKYDLHVLDRHHVEVVPPFFDTMVAHHLLKPEARHNLNDMSVRYLDYQPIGIERLIGKKSKQTHQKCMSQVPLNEITQYACEDADVTLQLYEKFKGQLVEKGLMSLFEQIEMPLLPVLVAMEKKGVTFDHRALGKVSENFQDEITSLVKEIYTQVGETFNIDSPKQLGDKLFEKLKLVKNPIKTKSGQYNTSQSVLSKLANQHAIIHTIIAYRELKKLKSTYVDALPTFVREEDGRIHTCYHQTHVYTGRLSSSDPNLQNIPIRTEKGRAIRKAFVSPKPDYHLVTVDYSQIELRFMAHFAQDIAMIDAFKTGKDIHLATAQKIFQIETEKITKSMRRQAKMVNFGIIYGISEFGLAQRLKISYKQANALIKAYFTEFPTVKTYMEQTIENVRNTGFVATLYGRKRFFPNIKSRNATIRNMDERAAINMPIQGSAAELIKKAMIVVHAWMQKEKLPAYMIMQVHDELVFEVHNSVLDVFLAHVKPLMERVMQLKVPLVVDICVGKNWLEVE